MKCESLKGGMRKSAGHEDELLPFHPPSQRVSRIPPNAFQILVRLLLCISRFARGRHASSDRLFFSPREYTASQAFVISATTTESKCKSRSRQKLQLQGREDSISPTAKQGAKRLFFFSLICHRHQQSQAVTHCRWIRKLLAHILHVPFDAYTSSLHSTGSDQIVSDPWKKKKNSHLVDVNTMRLG